MKRYRVCWKEEVRGKDDGWGSARMKGRLTVGFILPGLCHRALQKMTVYKRRLASVMKIFDILKNVLISH